ncbi:MAG: ATP-dependent Clp protease adapter ClpS [Magnetococcales bacterium]|nr:ATP-dependent Clp protease adapter ClpS [Magnetococcales bacterium]MBF0150194.1 ATP-dependent Clp protease adapter ClpS [Magnetococcales bacterium]MBF0173444.1 ATP-dependent Clp protease adapter ClpS [Magnetococcales bacterium]MBF0347920.1 ATP-dependent Clp protease adapter ClpS [Magnetococcales bacterium]MBF0631914.1 ATP-dependent Clp protease adapter ClpS [Magnetococcales bacterium]
MSGQETFNDTHSATQSRSGTQEPSLYKVVLLNDDFTPMDFVVELIMKFFRKSLEESTRIMLNVHHEGRGVCGIYPREIAETKVLEVNSHARRSGHPLKCLMERD